MQLRTPAELRAGVGLVAAIALVIGLAGCAGDDDPAPASSGPTVPLTATDTACEVGSAQLAAGPVTFAITNQGTKVTEVYVYSAGGQVVAERENIDAAETADLTVELAAGRYELACKPGMEGDGIRTPITVAAGAVVAADPRLTQAVDGYRAYVTEQVEASLVLTEQFVAAVKAGDVATAKQLYAPSRVGWESIEPVEESFGDIDPEVDLGEADLEAGQAWTGWHRIEKALWQQNSTNGMARYADQLLADLRDLHRRVHRGDDRVLAGQRRERAARRGRQREDHR